MRRLLMVTAEMGEAHCGEGDRVCEHRRSAPGPHGTCSLYRVDLDKPADGESHPKRLPWCKNAEFEATRVELLKRDHDLAMIEVLKAERAAGAALKPGETGVEALIGELQRLRSNYAEAVETIKHFYQVCECRQTAIDAINMQAYAILQKAEKETEARGQ